MEPGFEWVAEVEVEVTTFPDAGQLKAFLREQERLDHGQVFVSKDYGVVRARWWEACLRLSCLHQG